MEDYHSLLLNRNQEAKTLWQEANVGKQPGSEFNRAK